VKKIKNSISKVEMPGHIKSRFFPGSYYLQGEQYILKKRFYFYCENCNWGCHELLDNILSQTLAATSAVQLMSSSPKYRKITVFLCKNGVSLYRKLFLHAFLEIRVFRVWVFFRNPLGIMEVYTSRMRCTRGIHVLCGEGRLPKCEYG
jgi:hypothetical protein